MLKTVAARLQRRSLSVTADFHVLKWKRVMLLIESHVR